MGTIVAYGLLLLAVALFAFNYGKGKDGDSALDIATKVAGVVSLLAALATFVITDQATSESVVDVPTQVQTEESLPEPTRTSPPPPVATPQPEPTEPDPPAEPDPPEADDEEVDPDEDFIPDVTFSIFTGLGQGANFSVVEGQTAVFIDGNYEGEMVVNARNPTEKLDVTVPAPGRYSYSLESIMVITSSGQLFTLNCAGQGMVDVDHGDDFEVWGSMAGNSCLLRLES